MRLLFSSSDATLAERIQGMLARAGIPCEVRHVPVPSPLAWPFYAELWIQPEAWMRRATPTSTRCARLQRLDSVSLPVRSERYPH